MKDERLEKEFEEYFKGVKTPNNITDGAKAYAKKKPSYAPKIAKYASIAASIVLVCAVSLALLFSVRIDDGNNSPENPGDNAQGGNSSDGNYGDVGSDGNDGAPIVVRTYSSAELVYESKNVYSLSSIDPALKLIENFAYADNAQVSVCEAGYLNGTLAQVRAEVTCLGTARDDTEIYVEFTDEELIFEPLTEYLLGTVKSYKGCRYYLTRQTAEDGELVFKLYVYYGNVKYYVNVKSSDESSYMKYLEMIAG